MGRPRGRGVSPSKVIIEEQAGRVGNKYLFCTVYNTQKERKNRERYTMGPHVVEVLLLLLPTTFFL